MNFLRMLVLAAAVGVLQTSAIADDIDQGPVQWSGFYLGVNAGYGWSDVDVQFQDFALLGLGDGFSQDTEGYVVGGHAGYQRQFGSWVLGVDTTFNAGDVEGRSQGSYEFDTCPGFICVFGAGTEVYRTQLDDIITVSGKVGYTWSNLMAYLKGGYASADVSVSSRLAGELGGCIFIFCGSTPYGISADSEKRHHGWVIGGGGEVMLHPNVTLGLDYSYMDLDSATHNRSAAVDLTGDTIATSLRVDPDAVHTVSARLTFLLNQP